MFITQEFFQVSRIAMPLCYKKLHLFNIIKVKHHQQRDGKDNLLIYKQLISDRRKDRRKDQKSNQGLNKKSNFFYKNTNLIKKNEIFYKPSTIGLENFSNQPSFVFYQDNCDNTFLKIDKNIFTNLPVR